MIIDFLRGHTSALALGVGSFFCLSFELFPVVAFFTESLLPFPSPPESPFASPLESFRVSFSFSFRDLPVFLPLISSASVIFFALSCTELGLLRAAADTAQQGGEKQRDRKKKRKNRGGKKGNRQVPDLVDC